MRLLDSWVQRTKYHCLRRHLKRDILPEGLRKIRHLLYMLPHKNLLRQAGAFDFGSKDVTRDLSIGSLLFRLPTLIQFHVKQKYYMWYIYRSLGTVIKGLS